MFLKDSFLCPKETPSGSGTTSNPLYILITDSIFITLSMYSILFIFTGSLTKSIKLSISSIDCCSNSSYTTSTVPDNIDAFISLIALSIRFIILSVSKDCFSLSCNISSASLLVTNFSLYALVVEVRP